MSPIAVVTCETPDTDAVTAANDIPVFVHTCSRLGRVANPPRSWLPAWLTSRRGN
jgi:hypothetical protein